MYLINEILVFTPGRRQEALDRLAWIHGLMSPHQGFERALVARYLGNGVRHTVLRLWQDEAAFQRFRESPDGSYGRGRPEGLYRNEQVVPRWQGTGDVSGDGRGGFLVKTQRDVPEGAWAAFAAVQEEARRAMQAFGGLVEAGHFRAAEEGQALSVLRFESREAYERFLDSATMAALRGRLPAEAATAHSECFEVINEVRRKVS